MKQYNINISKNVTPDKVHNEINFDLLKNKIICGLVGYATSGKDTIGSLLVQDLGYQRVSFGDVLKIDLDSEMKEEVFVDLQKNEIDLSMEDIQFLNPKNRIIKEILRPYMKLYGENMKKAYGAQYWVNRAFSQIGEAKKIVITDVRRVNELEPFYIETNKKNNFESILFHISQYGLTDTDTMTHDCIRTATENWMFQDTVLIDSRIPDKDNLRQEHVKKHVDNLIEKFPYFFG